MTSWSEDGADHAGTTPIDMRADALLAAAKAIAAATGRGGRLRRRDGDYLWLYGFLTEIRQCSSVAGYLHRRLQKLRHPVNPNGYGGLPGNAPGKYGTLPRFII